MKITEYDVSIFNIVNKELEEILKCYNEAIELDPDDYENYYNKADTLQTLDRRAEALEYYDKVIELNPYHHASYNNKAILLTKLNRNEDALKCCNKAIELYSDDYEYFYNKGVILSKLDKKAEALECYNKAIELNNTSTYTYRNKAIILEELKEYNVAIKCYDKIIEIDQDFRYPVTNKNRILKIIENQKKDHVEIEIQENNLANSNEKEENKNSDNSRKWKCQIFTQYKTIYDNQILNHPNILNKFASKHGITKTQDLINLCYDIGNMNIDYSSLNEIEILMGVDIYTNTVNYQ